MAELRVPLLMGIDLGTSGVRAVVATGTGEAIAWGNAPLQSRKADGMHEQDAHDWWRGVCQATAQACHALRSAGQSPEQLTAVAIDGTSGTIVPLDAAQEPLRPAVMYNDVRAAPAAHELNRLAPEWPQRLGYRFDASFALAKIQWLADQEPALVARAARFAHQTDYITGRLTGDFAQADSSNALKTGYDLVDSCWPSWILNLPACAGRLPQVVPPGTRIGEVSGKAAQATGLPAGLTVVAGATDGLAAAISSGLSVPGDYNTTLGTTLVFKGLSQHLVRRPDAGIYSHRLPGGLWLPGAASNVGTAWISERFRAADPAELDRQAAGRLPGSIAAYPLVGVGERFPFANATARSFATPVPADSDEEYRAGLTGTALVERLAYDVLDEACGTAEGAVYATGGGSRSDIWMQNRADVTRRVYHRPRIAESSFGSAILAASGTIFGSLAEATQAMTRVTRTFLPDAAVQTQVDELYARWHAELIARGYLGRSTNNS